MKNLFNVLVALLVIVGFTQCDTNTTGEDTKGNVNFEMTDAPVDDANVESVFVTVAEVKVDGQTFDGFSGKQTIDIMAYQNGNTKALGLSELEAKSYNNISLVLDYETDASGNAPGCYVMAANGTKHDLTTESSSTMKEIVVAKNFDVMANQTTDIVLDFDLRKSIKYANSSSQSDYSFVTDAEMDAAVRPVEKDMAGTVKGKCNDNVSNSDKIVVFAYAKGTFNKDTETQAQGSSNITFKNAVTSSTVASNGDYQLSFLEEGDYELYFASYKDENNDGSFELKGLLNSGLLGVLSTNDVTVGAGANVTLDISISGLITL